MANQPVDNSNRKIRAIMAARLREKARVRSKVPTNKKGRR